MEFQTLCAIAGIMDGDKEKPAPKPNTDSIIKVLLGGLQQLGMRHKDTIDRVGKILVKG